jgi:hypothetical protein
LWCAQIAAAGGKKTAPAELPFVRITFTTGSVARFFAEAPHASVAPLLRKLTAYAASKGAKGKLLAEAAAAERKRSMQASEDLWSVLAEDAEGEEDEEDETLASATMDESED